MSSANRLNMLIDSAWRNNDVNAVRDAFSEYHAVTCLYPRKQDVIDAHTQTKRTITVKCGKCEHCVQSKINEWCTRMYAHAEDFKHLYFVTLTYRSFYDDQREVNKLMMNKLKSAIWHKDSYNSTKHYCYNPCLLVKKHYQDFLKRLRKNTGLQDISYVLSGEYGHDYGRPHFHMILFTNGVLTKHDIDRAWSVALWNDHISHNWSYKTNQKNNGSAHYFSIGRTDFNDLVTNGTLNTTAKIRVDGTYMNASNCFAYVCKYVCKQDHANLNRVRIAYNSMFHRETYTKVFENEIPYNIIKDYLLSVGYKVICDSQLDEICNKLITYEKILFQPEHSIYAAQDFQKDRIITVSDLSFSEPIFNENYFEFCNDFRPFCEFSRGCPIGSVYASRNLQEFTQGVYTKPLLQEAGFTVPTYFMRKASEYFYGLRKARQTRSGLSFALDGLVNLRGRLSESLQNDLPPREHFTSSDSFQTYEKALHDPYKLFCDLSSGERIILADGFARHYKYDRHSRSYNNTRNVRLADFIRYWCVRIDEEQKRHHDLLTQAIQNESARERSELIALDLGETITDLRNRYSEQREQVKRDAALHYHELHQSAE